jgi:hypothetical protein
MTAEDLDQLIAVGAEQLPRKLAPQGARFQPARVQTSLGDSAVPSSTAGCTLGRLVSPTPAMI